MRNYQLDVADVHADGDRPGTFLGTFLGAVLAELDEPFAREAFSFSLPSFVLSASRVKALERRGARSTSFMSVTWSAHERAHEGF